MTLTRHELKQSRISLMIWTLAIGVFLVTCVFLFPEMKDEMGSINDAFSSMGSFSTAFGMDQLNFGTLIGFYSIECGNVLGIGGSLFASLIAISVLAKEEKEHTSEFLFTHPVKRSRVITEKLISVLIQLVLMNAIAYGLAVGSIAFIGENIPWKELNLLHFAYFLLQIELAGICFGISAFLRRKSIGIGLGIAIAMYCLNLIANITEKADFLKYLTPFGYAEGADIVTNGKLNATYVCIGMTFMVIGIGIAYWKYQKKDIH